MSARLVSLKRRSSKWSSSFTNASVNDRVQLLLKAANEKFIPVLTLCIILLKRHQRRRISRTLSHSQIRQAKFDWTACIAYLRHRYILFLKVGYLIAVFLHMPFRKFIRLFVIVSYYFALQPWRGKSYLFWQRHEPSNDRRWLQTELVVNSYCVPRALV